MSYGRRRAHIPKSVSTYVGLIDQASGEFDKYASLHLGGREEHLNYYTLYVIYTYNRMSTHFLVTKLRSECLYGSSRKSSNHMFWTPIKDMYQAVVGIQRDLQPFLLSERSLRTSSIRLQLLQNMRANSIQSETHPTQKMKKIIHEAYQEERSICTTSCCTL